MTINSTNTIPSSAPFSLVTRQWCQPCEAAKNLLSKNNIDYLEIKSENLTDEQKEKLDTIEYNFYPQIYRWGEDDIWKESFIWGYQELEELSKQQFFEKNVKNNTNKTLEMNTNRQGVPTLENKDSTDMLLWSSAAKNPVQSALNNKKNTALWVVADEWATWALIWWAYPLWYIAAWGSLLWWAVAWVAATAVWVLLQKKTEKWKNIWIWMEQWWIVSTSLLGALALEYGVLGTIASFFWIAFATSILLYFLTGRHIEAKKLLEEQVWEEKADTLMKKIEEAWGDDLKEEIRAKAEEIIDDMKEVVSWDSKKVIRV